MSHYRCNACRGEYADAGADGILYFHTCPPITVVRVQRGGQWTRVPLADLRPTDTIRVRRGDAEVETLVSAQLPGDVRLGDRQRPRPAGEHRDENSAIAGGELEGKRRIKAKGQGRTEIPAPPPSED